MAKFMVALLAGLAAVWLALGPGILYWPPEKRRDVRERWLMVLAILRTPEGALSGVIVFGPVLVALGWLLRLLF